MEPVDILYMVLSVSITVFTIGFFVLVWQAVILMKRMRFAVMQVGKVAIQADMARTTLKLGLLGTLRRVLRRML